jgi:hypothetical protein
VGLESLERRRTIDPRRTCGSHSALDTSLSDARMTSLHEFLFQEFHLQIPKGSSTRAEESRSITTDGGPLI